MAMNECGHDVSLPPSRIGKVTRRKKIDGSPLVYRVEDDDCFVAPSNHEKAFLLQRLRLDDGDGLDNGHNEFRVSYYMIAHKPRMKGRWAFGQSAPMMIAEEMKLIVDRLRKKGWLQE
jgi:hypothetical protein